MGPASCELTDEAGTMRERRCVVTGAVKPEDRLIRFVAGPDGSIVPDVAARLPGRGLWVTADRRALELAVAKNHFSRAAGVPLSAPADLPERVELQLVRRLSDQLGLARRSGQLVTGFDSVARAFQNRTPPALLVEASDGSADGRRKLLAMAAARSLTPAILDCLTSSELSLALGRENVVHAALNPGRLSERVRREAGRLGGFRPPSGRVKP